MNIYSSAKNDDFLNLVRASLDKKDALLVVPSPADFIKCLLEGGFRSVPSIVLADLEELNKVMSGVRAINLPELYVIALLSLPDERERALESGADDYLILPVSKLGLSKRLEAARSVTLLRLAGHRIQRSSRAIVFGRLVPYIIHSINNPLQTVQGALTLASEENESNENLKEYLKLADDQTDRVVTQIGKLRRWVRVEPSQAQSIDPQTLFTGLEEVLDGYLKNRNIQLEFGEFANCPSIRVAPDQVSIYLLNLLVDLAEVLDPENGAHIELAGNGHNGYAVIEAHIKPLQPRNGKAPLDPALIAQVLMEFCCAQAALLGGEAEYDPANLSLRLRVPA